MLTVLLTNSFKPVDLWDLRLLDLYIYAYVFQMHVECSKLLYHAMPNVPINCKPHYPQMGIGGVNRGFDPVFLSNSPLLWLLFISNSHEIPSEPQKLCWHFEPLYGLIEHMHVQCVEYIILWVLVLNQQMPESVTAEFLDQNMHCVGNYIEVKFPTRAEFQDQIRSTVLIIWYRGNGGYS